MPRAGLPRVAAAALNARAQQADASGALLLRREALRSADTTGWPSWNLGREAARAALATLDR